MREFAIFVSTFCAWAVTGLGVSLFGVGLVAVAMWVTMAQLAPYFPAEQVQWLGILAGIVSGLFSGTGVIIAFSTLAAEAQQSAGNASNRAPPKAPSGTSGVKRSASSPPLPGSTRPDPRKEHNP